MNGTPQIDPATLLICWVDPQSADAVSTSPELHDTPAYFQGEIHSLAGRPARGRLWISSELPDIDIGAAFEDPQTSPATIDLVSQRGGIVIRPEDRAQLSRFGIITDQKLNFKG